MVALGAREWLEAIVRTGAQRSGFADEALALLDEAEDAQDGLAERDELADRLYTLETALADVPGRTLEKKAAWAAKALNDLAELTGALDKTLVPLLTEREAAWFDVRCRMIDNGLCHTDATTEQVLAALSCFVPAAGDGR